MKVLLDRGANMEAKDRVSAASKCCLFATGRAGRHGWACRGQGEVVPCGRVVLLWRAGV